MKSKIWDVTCGSPVGFFGTLRLRRISLRRQIQRHREMGVVPPAKLQLQCLVVLKQRYPYFKDEHLGRVW